MYSKRTIPVSETDIRMDSFGDSILKSSTVIFMALSVNPDYLFHILIYDKKSPQNRLAQPDQEHPVFHSQYFRTLNRTCVCIVYILMGNG